MSYYALDLMKSELERTLADVPEYQHVKCHGLLGTYDDGLAWLRKPENAGKPKTILSMGSSIGNFPRDEAVGFVKQFADVLGPNDSLLFGIDACQKAKKVHLAYNDSEGYAMSFQILRIGANNISSVTHEFVANGLRHANDLLGYEAFKAEDWEVVGEYDEEGGRHRAFVVPKKDVTVEGVALKQGEKIRIEESYKYNEAQAQELWHKADVIQSSAWPNGAGDYGAVSPRLLYVLLKHC